MVGDGLSARRIARWRSGPSAAPTLGEPLLLALQCASVSWPAAWSGTPRACSTAASPICRGWCSARSSGSARRWLLPSLNPAMRLIVGAAIVAIYAALTASELWSERRRTMHTRWPAIVVPVMHGCVLTLPILLGESAAPA